jgi:vancomycin resistance protein VanJ
MDNATPPDASGTGAAAPARGGSIVLVCGAVLALLLTFVYRRQPDSLAAFTVIPAWCLLLAGVGGLLWRVRRRRTWPWRLACLAWVMFGVLCVGELESLARGLFPVPSAENKPGISRLRIITINCGVGNVRALEEAVALRPDLLLVQESPGMARLLELARQHFDGGDIRAWGGDTSIIARGELEPVWAQQGDRFLQATWRLPEGPVLHVTSLRLAPPPVRIDYWDRDCWTVQTERRRGHREQIERIVDRLADVPLDRPVIVGGDFNCPAGDRATHPLRERLRDSFELAGRGWGNTITREFPFHRIDQIWVSPALSPVQVFAVRTPHSDHRMVVADLQIAAAP